MIVIYLYAAILLKVKVPTTKIKVSAA